MMTHREFVDLVSRMLSERDRAMVANWRMRSHYEDKADELERQVRKAIADAKRAEVLDEMLV